MFESTPTSTLNSPADSLVQLPDRVPRRTLRRCTSSSLFSESSKITLNLPTKAEPSVYLTVRTSVNPFGSFSPTPPATASLQFFATPSRPPSAWSTPAPKRTRSIPSISRTASSFSIDELARSPISPVTASLLDFEHDYAPASKHQPIPLPDRPRDATAPALASLEKRSRLTKRVHCATCRTPGTNFPACARCGDAWCSRVCRLPNGVRHVCSVTAPLSRTGISRTPLVSPPSTTPATPRNV
ncbi:hypothetical protein DFH07DRAFT_792976 [Mycena maculata]|uniref:Uncharacterized protein n=1 Tax=Mycena maculata TaxID=230809 RepID=A0AAD7KAN0_9AGAR|nr:hypothetical protein DFH07DRAFT_792976 [Mycena maculata]